MGIELTVEEEIKLTEKEKSLLKQFYDSQNDMFKYTRKELSQDNHNLIGAMELGRKGLIDAITGRELLDKNIINQNIEPSQTYYFITKKGLDYVDTIRN